jgi:16S rRNA processing protein RimM
LTDRLILVGQIGQAHGLKGEVKLTSFTQDPESLIAYSPLLTQSGREISVEKLKPVKGAFYAVLKGITDRNQSEALQGEKLYVPREKLPEPEAGVFYQADLIGLELQTLEGEAIGRVEAMVNYGGGDLLDVALPGRAQTVLIPFKGAEVDLKAGLIRLALPEGLLEED